MQSEKCKTINGFTLVEILLALALIAFIAGISIPVYQSFQVKNELDNAFGALIQTLRRAQLLSQAVEGDSSWGVYLQSDSLTLFKGTNFAARDTNFDEIFTFQTELTPSGLQEVVFSKFTGLPQATGTIALTTNTGETKSATINEKGTINH